MRSHKAVKSILSQLVIGYDDPVIWIGTVILTSLATLETTAISTSVCELGKTPEPYSNKLVSIRAEIVVGFEVQSLVDPLCPHHRLWFEVGEQVQRNSGFKSFAKASKNNDFNLRRRISGIVIGEFVTDSCFGHQCFSRSQIVVDEFQDVVAIERRLALGFSLYDCDQLRRQTKVTFRTGHIDNVLPRLEVINGRRSIILMGPNESPITAQLNPILQIAVTSNRLTTLLPGPGGFRLPKLVPGAYVFSAVAPGFQSVTGCLVVRPEVAQSSPTYIELPLGV